MARHDHRGRMADLERAKRVEGAESSPAHHIPKQVTSERVTSDELASYELRVETVSGFMFQVSSGEDKADRMKRTEGFPPRGAVTPLLLNGCPGQALLPILGRFEAM